MDPALERVCSVVPLRGVDIMEISFNSNQEICSFQTRHLPRTQIESTRLSHFGVDIAEISSNSGGDIWRFQKDYWSRLQIESVRLSPFGVDIVEISSNSDESILSFQKGEMQTTAATCFLRSRIWVWPDVPRARPATRASTAPKIAECKYLR